MLDSRLKTNLLSVTGSISGTLSQSSLHWRFAEGVTGGGLSRHFERSRDVRELTVLVTDSSTPLGMHDQMKVRVLFYAQLRDLFGMRQLDVDVADGATVRDLLGKIMRNNRRFGRMTRAS
jgi:hypothetical protein